jgi:hypothetical protein
LTFLLLNIFFNVYLFDIFYFILFFLLYYLLYIIITMYNRVPGNFHIEMRSKHHNFNPKASNLSHIVNSLSFGPILPRNAGKLFYYYLY